MMRRWGWLLSTFFGLVCVAFIALFFWPLPTLADCTQVSGRVSVVYVDDVGTGSRARRQERLNFKLDSSERYFRYSESDPHYSEVKSRLRVREEVRIWHKEPPAFVLPLYSKELWRIDVGDETLVDYDTLAADAGWAKGIIALVGLGMCALVTVITLGATLRGAKRDT